MLNFKSSLYLLAWCLTVVSCSHLSDLELHKKPNLTDPEVRVKMNGYYYSKGNDFDALLILFDDGKVYFRPYIESNEPDTTFKYILEGNNTAIGGTRDYWGNYNIIRNKINIEYIYKDKQTLIFNVIDCTGTLEDSITISISTISCTRFKNKPCKSIGNNEFNPSLSFKFYPKEFYIQKAKFYEEKWYLKDDWNYNIKN